ncbi:MAG TPA: choice-of-anchor J domain-containing protein [Candidatus Thermoplasmatota archaeon]|nr:choice-of-anchor J domain-containing protein [Candidatus Thermoplasmatota archaeon]
MSRLRDDGAASSVASFIVALGVFSLTFAGVTYFLMDYIGQTAPLQNVDAAGKADAGLDVLLSGPGIPETWENLDWSSNSNLEPDRLGLLAPGSRTKVDYEKLRRLQGTLPGLDGVSTSLFGQALGLDDHQLFLRSYPIYSRTAAGVVDWPDGYDVAYVASVTGGGALTEAAKVEAASLDRLDIDYVNSTVQTAPVVTNINVPVSVFTNGDRFPDSVATLKSHLLPRLAGFAYALDNTEPTVPNCETLSAALHLLVPTCDNYVRSNYTWNNSYWKVLRTSSLPVGAGFSASTADHILTPSRYARTGPSTAAWTYSYPDENWLITPTIPIGSSLGTITLHLNQSVLGVDRAGDGWDDAAEVLVLCASCGPSQNTRWTSLARWTSNGATGPGDFQHNTVDLSDYAGATVRLAFRWNASSYLDGLTSAGPLDLTGYNMLASSQGWFLRDIHLDGVSGATVTPLWRNSFNYSEELSQYQLLVFGSNVNQAGYGNDGLSSPEVSHVFRHAIADWVEAGGKLIALGSNNLRNDWLYPTLTGTPGTASLASGPVSLYSELDHPSLMVPFVLDDTLYLDEDHVSVGRYVPATDASGDSVFTAPLVNAQREPILMITTGNTGYAGDVLLTSLTPWEFPTREVDHFFQNAIAYLRFRSLYVDFGAPVHTAGTAVGSASRVALVETGDTELGNVELRLTLYAWR